MIGLTAVDLVQPPHLPVQMLPPLVTLIPVLLRLLTPPKSLVALWAVSPVLLSSWRSF